MDPLKNECCLLLCCHCTEIKVKYREKEALRPKHRYSAGIIIFAEMVQSDLRFSLKHKITDESYSQGMVEEPILLLLAEQHRIAYGVIDRPRQKAVVLRDYRIVSEQPDTFTPKVFSHVYWKTTKSCVSSHHNAYLPFTA